MRCMKKYLLRLSNGIMFNWIIFKQWRRNGNKIDTILLHQVQNKFFSSLKLLKAQTPHFFMNVYDLKNINKWKENMNHDYELVQQNSVQYFRDLMRICENELFTQIKNIY